MSVNLQNHFVQQYGVNQALLLAVRGGKLRDKVTVSTYVGEQASPVDQYGSVRSEEVTTRFADMPRMDVDTYRRWVTPRSFHLNQMVDSFDQLRLITDPKHIFVENAVRDYMLTTDQMIIEAFFASAKTGKTGSGSTAFTSANEVDVAVGGAQSKLNIAKLKAMRELMMANHVDFEMEEVYVGCTAADYTSLMSDPQFIHADYNGGRDTLASGRLPQYLGFNLVQSEQFETLLAGTNEVTLPVWCKSGMHLGEWGGFKNSASIRNDIISEPWQVYTSYTVGATRLEEDKVYAIESYRA